VIVSDLPQIFAEFHGKASSLLWRDSRVDFRGYNCHGYCDWHANTLTELLNTKGNIVGVYTPVEWESTKCPAPQFDGECGYEGADSESEFELEFDKAAPSLKLFVFTLKNPHNVPALRFRRIHNLRNTQLCVSPAIVHIFMTSVFWITATRPAMVTFGRT
jgi:uncharacterized protein YuzB (UPF0349 family)